MGTRKGGTRKGDQWCMLLSYLPFPSLTCPTVAKYLTNVREDQTACVEVSKNNFYLPLPLSM